jgi:hypothetical protein
MIKFLHSMGLRLLQNNENVWGGIYIIYSTCDSNFSSDVQVKLREMKPGSLSQELKESLGMPEGAPPPWLINMQVRLADILYLLLKSAAYL